MTSLRHSLVLRLCFVFCVSFLILPVFAAGQSNWNGGTGLWSDSNNWTPTGVPAYGSSVVIGAANSIVTVDTYDPEPWFLDIQLASDQVNITGALSVDITLSNAGTINNQSQLFTSNTFNNSGLVAISGANWTNGGGAIVNNSGTFQLSHNSNSSDSGTFNNNAGGVLTVDTGAFYQNQGILNNNVGASITVGSGSFLGVSGTLNNYGTVTSAFAGTNLEVGTLNNYAGGIINGASGYVADGGDNYGSIDVSAPTAHNSFGPDATFINLGTLTNHYHGTIKVEQGSTLLNTYFNASHLGIFNNNAGIVTVLGDFENYGTVNAAGAFVVTSGGVLNNHGTFNSTNGNFQVSAGGLVNDYSNTNITSGGQIQDSGTFNEYGTLSIPSGSGSFSVLSGGTLLLAGTLNDMTSSSLIVRGNLVVDGTLNAASAPFFFSSQVSGHGVINGDVTLLTSVMSPGNSPGRLTINGNYSQDSSSTFLAELAGLTVGTQYDQLAVSGNASLDGTLDLVLLNGFVVQLGDNFVLMTYSSESGQFATLDLPTLKWGEGWQLSYNANDLTLSVVAVPTPEPGSMLLLASGIQGVGTLLRRRLGKRLPKRSRFQSPVRISEMSHGGSL